MTEILMPSTFELRQMRQRLEAIVIGASAGGIEALSTLLPPLPHPYPLPIIVVLHVPPDRPSQLEALFAAKCRVPVHEAEDKMPVQPGHVYFAPPGYHLLIEADRTFSLSTEPPVFYSRPSVDVLFESASYVWREKLMGVLLSGANDDGGKGLAEIHGRGGVTIVQHPSTASAPEMPRAGIASHTPSWVLPLAPMAQLLAGLSK